MERIDFHKTWKLHKDNSFEKIDMEGSIEQIESNFLAVDGGPEIDNSLDQLDCKLSIVDKLLECSGSWSVIYFRPDLKCLFVGRDIFGRTSLVWSRREDSLLISCSVHNDLSTDWHEIPYGQITVMDTSNLVGEMHSYFPVYPEDQDSTWRSTVAQKPLIHHELKQEMVTVSRMLSCSLDFDPIDEMYSRLTDATRSMIPDDACEVCVAFSGGVDSTLVAHSVIRASKENVLVTLINVAFGADQEKCSAAPDRSRAILAYNQLKSVSGGRKLRLLLRDVDAEELAEKRTQFISKAVAPACSVLDDSLGCVLWFALEGKGREYETGESASCGSDLFFVGSGADEMFAGYARHRTRFERDGAAPIAEECEAELRRLGSRNGGRDGRVAAQLGRTLAAPFMSDPFVVWSNALPLDAKCDLSLPRGVGEKRIIRQVLHRLGAPHDAPKQAMQFGSRMAKMSNNSKLIKGSDISDHLTKDSLE